MQTHATHRLAQKLAAYAILHSRMQTAIRYGITDPAGHPSHGLVTLLISGYEPRRPDTRIRLGLPAKIPAPRRSINNHLATDAIQDMPGPLLRWALENRIEAE
jgi:hypothetical protein